MEIRLSFVQKIFISFYQDTKMIGIYKNAMRNNIDGENDFIYDSTNDGIQNKNNVDNSNNSSVVKITIIFGLIILIILIEVLIFKFGKNIFNKDYKNSKYSKSSVAHDSRNKNEVQEYYKLGKVLMD